MAFCKDTSIDMLHHDLVIAICQLCKAGVPSGIICDNWSTNRTLTRIQMSMNNHITHIGLQSKQTIKRVALVKQTMTLTAIEESLPRLLYLYEIYKIYCISIFIWDNTSFFQIPNWLYNIMSDKGQPFIT